MKKILRHFNFLVVIIFILNYIFANGFWVSGEEQKNISDINFALKDVSFNSASFYWEYPQETNFDMGDYLNLILIDDEIGERGQVPVFSEAHNRNNVNLKSINSFEAKGLAPSRSYTAKLEIVKSNGDSHTYEQNFKTEDFEISNMSFQNVEDGKTKTKNVRLTWSVTNTSLKFGDGDKINIFMKKYSDNDFSKIPIFESNEMVTRADIKLPNFEEIYEFKIVYTIGNKNIESEIFEIDASAGGINFKMKDITTSSVKLNWVFEDEEILNEDSSIQIFLKEDKEIEYDEHPILEIKGKENLLIKKEHLVENLKFSTKYNLKIKFVIENFEDFGESSPVFKEDEYEFETKDFSLTNVKIENISDNKCNLSWDYAGENISFSSGDSLNIYIKESSSNGYSQPAFTISQDLSNIKNSEITFPKFNTNYDVKISFSIGGKELSEYTSHIIELPKVDFKIGNITDTSLKFIPSFNNISFSQGDKIQFFVKKNSDEDYPIAPTKELVHLSSENILSISEIDLDLNQQAGQSLDIKVNILKNSVVVQENVYNVKMKNELQIVRVFVDRKSENSVKAIVEYAPYDFDFQNVESLCLYKNVEGDSQQSLHSEIKENFRDNNSFDIEFDKFQNYKLSFIYKFKDTQIPESRISRSGEDAGDSVQQEGENANDGSDVQENDENSNIENPDEENIQGSGGESSDSGSAQPDAEEPGDQNSTDQGSDGESNNGNQNGDEIENSKPDNDQSSNDGEVKENGGESAGEESEGNNSAVTEVRRDEIYNHKFDAMEFQLQDVVLSDIKFKFKFDKNYTVKNGDKIEIFLKKEGEENFSEEAIVKFEHGKDSIDLNNIGVIDITGLDNGTKYIFKSKFISSKYSSNVLEKEIEVTTNAIEFSNIEIHHVSDLTAMVKWKLGKNFEFSPNDSLDIFYKKESQENYPDRPNETLNDIYIEDGAFIYLDNIDTKYDIKLIFRSGAKTFEKEFKLNTEVDVVNAEISEIYETSAYIKWDYPENYFITDGEAISIFVKESNAASYGDNPDYFLEQNEENGDFLKDFRSAKLFDLMPNTNYDVKVILEFGEVGKKEREVSFKTKDMSISDLIITDIKPFEFNIAWDADFKTVDFNEEYDFLNVYMKTSEESWSDENLVYESSKDLNDFKKMRFIIDNPENIYDVKIEYNLVSGKISKTSSIKLFTLSYKEIEYGNIDVSIRYPSPVSFEDGDEIILFLRKPKTNSYEQKFLSKHSVINNLNSVTSVSLKDVAQTSHIASFINSKKVNIFPTQITYDTRAQNSSTLEIISELKGSSIDIDLPIDYELDVTSEIRNSIGGNSYYEELDDGTYVIVINGIVPGKTYRETLLLTSDVYGNEVELFLDEFKLEPSNLLEEFLRNSYFFAFDREPDEGGYTYWKDELLKKGDITGKYFLVNLMFAEKEFSDRNLGDEDLIKVLYQIVVNREYDSKGLSYWVAIYKQYLSKFNNDQYEAKKTIVLRMVHEPEFQQLCNRMDVNW